MSRILPVLVLVAACADAPPPARAAPAAAVAPLGARCPRYPLAWNPAQGAREVAALELTGLSPTARMTWNDARGALSNISQLNVPLPGCGAGADASVQARSFLAAHPRLFQIDVAEWPVQPELDCAFVPSTGLPLDLTMGRLTIAGKVVRHDIFQVSLKKIGGVVNVTSVSGTYLPVANQGFGELLEGCDAVTDPRAAIANIPLEAPVYRGEFICQPSSTLAYWPQANDTFTLAPSAQWTWGEDASGVTFSGTRTLRVTVNPANYTPELISSGARCPVLDGPEDAFTIGWDVTIDVHTGEVLFIKPGLDCDVC